MKSKNRVKSVFEGEIAMKWESKGELFHIVRGVDNIVYREIDFWGKPGMSVLDVGCGTGKTLAYIDKKYKECSLYGIDLSEGMIQQAESKKYTNKIQFIRDDFIDYDFTGQEFDLIIFKFVLHHLEDIKCALQKAKCLLKEQGKLIIYTPGERHFEEIFPFKSTDDPLGRISFQLFVDAVREIGYEPLISTDCRFGVQFDNYDKFECFLKRTGSYQRIVNYNTIDWDGEFRDTIFRRFEQNMILTGNYYLGTFIAK